jgi:hypothetical protein
LKISSQRRRRYEKIHTSPKVSTALYHNYFPEKEKSYKMPGKKCKFLIGGKQKKETGDTSSVSE